MKKLAITCGAIFLLAGGLAAQDDKSKDKPKAEPPHAEKVKIPLEALGEILKRNPNGRLMSEKDWKELLAQAGVSSLNELAPTAEAEKPPVSWTVSGATFTGDVRGEQVFFSADATVRVLEAKSVLIPLPLAAVGARDVRVDGADAKLVRDVDGYSVILDGAGEKRITWSFSLPIEKGEERGAGAFMVPLLRSSVASSLKVTLAGDLEVASAQCALSVEHDGVKTTTATAACGTREVVKVEFRPRTAEAEATPYVTVEDASCFVVRRGLVQLELAAHFGIHRTGAERFAIDLPAGFSVRELNGSVRDKGERGAAPWGGTWVQRGDRVDLALPKARQGELAVVLRAELVAPQEGAVDMKLAAYPGSARSSGLVGVARGDDMNVVVTDAKTLERADLDALAVKNLAGVLRVYRHGSATGQVFVTLKPIEPKVALALRVKQEILDRELRLDASYEFHVLEGKVYQFRCELPGSWRVDQTGVFEVETRQGPPGQGQNQNQGQGLVSGSIKIAKHELRTETASGKTILVVDLEGGVRAGTGLRVDVTAAREVPAGIASEKSVDVPVLAGSPATTTSGYLAFSVDEAFRLRGDVKGLLPVPVEALLRAAFAGNFALGFKVDRPDYSGALTLVKKETRVAARTLVYYQIDERTIATDAKLDFDIHGAPVDALELVIPADAAKLVRIDGDDVAGDAPSTTRGESAGTVGRTVRLKGPKSGRVTLYVHFDTQVAGFEKAEGAAKTKTLLPLVHAGEGCERERGQLAVFSSDSTEITAAPEHLHAIEVTELEAHPAVKPAGRPLCAFTYANLDWSLGIEIVRHEGAAVLGAIVEQLTVTTSFGRDGVSRHTAKFRVKNLAHQFFNLKVPEGARIWSVLVDGVGVKPAADGDQKIIPLTKAGSADRAVEVAVTYEVKNPAMGRFGSGGLTSPVLLEKSGGEPIPVLKTSWSLALPDEFRYFEFSGNATGGVAAVEAPLLVRWWESEPDSLVLWTGLTIFFLALFAGEKSREKLLGLGKKLLAGLASGSKAARQVELPRKRFLVGAVGVVVLLFVVWSIFATAGGKAEQLYSKSARAIDSHVTKAIRGDSGGWGYGRTAPVSTSGSMPQDAAPASPPPMPPPSEEAAEKPVVDEILKLKAGERRDEDDRAAPSKKRKAYKDSVDEKNAPESKPAAPAKAPAPMAEPDVSRALADGTFDKALQLEGKLSKDALPAGTTSFGLSMGGKEHVVSGEELQKKDAPAHRALARESAFGEKGLASLVIALPYVGKTWTFTHEGGPAEIGFSFVRSDVWTVAMGLFAIAGFAAGFVVPRKTKVSYVALLVLAFVVLSTLPYVLAPSLTGGPVNAFLAGLALSAPVIALLSIDRARLRRVRLLGFVAPRLPAAPRGTGAALVVLGAILFSATPAHAQDRRVYVPYDPDHPDKKQDKVFVPEDLYDELWKKAHPEAKAVERPAAPAAYAISGVRYEGAVSTEGGLELKARFRLEILREGWVEAPIGLEGASIKEQVIAPEGAKLRPSATGYTLLAQGPKTFDLTLTLLLPQTNGVYTAGAIRAGAAVMKLGTAEKDKAIKVLGALGGQTETARAAGGVDVDASLGATGQIRIAFGAKEVIATGGGSDASVMDEAVYFVRRGRVELTQSFVFTVSGEGREAFLFSVPAGFEVTSVETDALRGFSVKDGVLSVNLRRPCARVATVVVKGERGTAEASFELPELSARAVTREEGRFAVAVESGLKVKFGKDDGLRQIDPSEVSVRVRTAAERAYAFTKRPAKLGLELLDEPLELRCTARALGVVRGDRFDVVAELEYVVKKGRTYELRILAPSDLELAGDPQGLDVRERVVEKVASGTRYTFGLAKALATNASAVMKLRFSKTLRQDDVRVSIPDVRALDVVQEDGEVALCVAEGLSLKGEKDVEEDRFSSTDPDPIARSLGAKDVKPQLGWRRKAKAPAGLSQATASIEHPRAHVEGTAVTFATVERDVVRTAVRVYYELSEAGAKDFSFRLPAHLAKRVNVVAPNQRELTFGSPSKDGDDEEARVPFTVALQSAVKNFYELTMEWEEPVPPTGKLELSRLDLVSCDRVRAFVLVEGDPSLTDKLEAGRCSNVEKVRAEAAFALPPGKDPRDFTECFRAEKPEWKVALELKAVEQQAPAPCRVETARVTSVIHDDGSVLHRAVWRVRNRSLQFLGVKLPKGATVWTVHVAGEPKRLHTENGISLIPLPKRADADMGFEVQLIYKTQLDGPLGLLKKLTPAAPVLATKGVTVERTFWTVYLPPKYDAAWTSGNMDESAEAVAQAQQIKARVQELAKLSSIAANAKSENERQVALTNVNDNYALVQRDYDAALTLANGALLNSSNSQKLNVQLLATTKDLEQLKAALGDVAKKQQEIGGQQAQQAQQRTQNAQQLEVVYGSNKFAAQRPADWRLSTGTFKNDRSMQFEGLEGELANRYDNYRQDAREVDEKRDQESLALLRRSLDPEAPADKTKQEAPSIYGSDYKPKAEHLGRAVDGAHEGGAKLGNKGGQAGGGQFAFDDDSEDKKDEKKKSDDGRTEREKVAGYASARAGVDGPTNLGVGGGSGGGGRGLSRPRRTVNAPDPAKPEPARVVRDLDLPVDQPDLKAPPAQPARFGKLEETEGKKTLLSIGFEFEVPQGSEPLHFTTDSNAEDGMQLSLTVMPRSSVERGGRLGRALVVLLVLLSAVRLGLVSGTDKKVARALGLLVAGVVAGLVFVHVAFAALAVVASIGALIKSRSLRS